MSLRSRAARQMNYCARITTEPAAAKEVRVFGLGSFFLRRFRARFETAFAEMRQVRLAHLRRSAAFTALHALALGGGDSGMWPPKPAPVSSPLGISRST